MSRRFRFFSIIGVAAIGTTLAAFGGWRYARASAPVNGPIILISVDTLRADHLSAYGYRNAATPAIDALAADGIVFERAYTHAAETLPAHVSMLSGRLPFETGVRGDDGHLSKEERLLPRMLRDRGYTTAGIVSAGVLGPDAGIPDGFDFFDTALAGDDQSGGAAAARRPGVQTEQVAEHWLDMQSSSRVFLFLHLYDAHRPYPAAEDADEAGRYDAQVARADDAIGRLVRWLKQRQLYDRTTILLTADHGEGLGDHGEAEHGLFAYEETVRVPLILKQAAGDSGATRRVATPVQIIDIVPTVLDLAKAPVPGNLRGRSLKPVIEGGATVSHEAIYSEARYGKRVFGWAPIATVTDGKYRYIAAPREELYDLTADPAERHNVIDSNAAAVPLRAALESIAGRVDPSGVRADHSVGSADHSVGNADRSLGSADRSLGSADLQVRPEDLQVRPEEGPLDPKDGVEVAEAYRRNLELAAEEQTQDALAGFRALSGTHPELAAVWRQVAGLSARAGRYSDAAEAYDRLIALDPDDPDGHLGNAAVLIRLHRLEDATSEARLAAELPITRPRERLAARMLLVEIALLSGDAEQARAEAALARKIDSAVPLDSYVEARILYDDRDYEAAAAAFERTLAASRAAQRPIPDLHYYAGDTLARLERNDDAVAEFEAEVRAFPINTRARLALASLYESMGRADEAAATVSELLRLAPTPDNYAQAAKLWTSLGNRRQADAVRAEGRRAQPAPKPSLRR